MRRDTLKSALDKIANDLDDSGVLELLNDLSSSEKNEEKKTEFFEIFQRYMVATANYGSAELAIMRIFKISQLLEPDVWRTLSEISPTSVRGFAEKVENVYAHVREIVQLISQDYVQLIQEESIDIPSELRGKSLITTIISEEEGTFSKPDRIIAAIKSISDLYWVHASLDEVDTDDIIFLSCDSGSDKSFDFLGAAKVVSALKETIIFIWDRIVFFRHAQAAATIDTIAKTLPVLERISHLETSNEMAPELAEQMRRKVLGACAGFVEAGVIIPEMEREAVQAPRLLMAPERRLLAGPARKFPEHVNEKADREEVENIEGKNDFDLAAEINELKRRLSEAERTRSPQRKPRRSRPATKKT